MDGISVQVDTHEFVYQNKAGNIVHTKQFGKNKPPTVTLKGGVSPNKLLWKWHQSVRNGRRNARRDMVLRMTSASGKVIRYKLHNAWVKDLVVSGVKAGNNQPPLEEITIQCEAIEMMP